MAVQRRNHVAEGAVLTDTELGSNAHVLSGAELHDTSIDNAVALGDARIEDSEITRSLIDREATADSVALNATLIGEQTECAARIEPGQSTACVDGCED